MSKNVKISNIWNWIQADSENFYQRQSHNFMKFSIFFFRFYTRQNVNNAVYFVYYSVAFCPIVFVLSGGNSHLLWKGHFHTARHTHNDTHIDTERAFKTRKFKYRNPKFRESNWKYLKGEGGSIKWIRLDWQRTVPSPVFPNNRNPGEATE